MTPLQIFLQVVLPSGIVSAIVSSVFSHYSLKEIEKYRFQQLQRQKAELIAALFSKWIKYRGRERMILSKPELLNYYEELNSMSLEISLWMNNDLLLKDIMTRLANAENAKTIRALVGDVRKLILEQDTDFDPETIILWPKREYYKELFDITD